MRRQSLFWGITLILVSGLFVLKALGIISDVLGFFWPLFLILLGAWMIAWYFIPRAEIDESEPAIIALGGAKQAKVSLKHGAGQVEICSGAPPEALLTVNQGIGINLSSNLKGDILSAKIEAGPTFVPFIGPAGGIWRVRLNNNIPLSLDVEAGASQLNLDLNNLKVNYLKLETGASTVKITTPARGITLMDFEAGAASLEIIIPAGVAGRIRAKEGFFSLNLDEKRFPRMEGRVYQSPDYDQAVNRVEINIEAGAGSVRIH